MRTRSSSLLLLSVAAFAQAPSPAPAPPKPAPVKSQRMSASAMRNENVAIYRIDTNAAKEASVRSGSNVTLLSEAPAESNWFAAELGRPASGNLNLTVAPRIPAWHGELFHRHQNSAANARSFFQVGSVQPSRQNAYGAQATGSAGRLGYLTLSAGQRKVRGMVNGNVLVPLPEERTPLATDPAVRAFVQKLLNGFPNIAPNRPDFDARALNINAPQSINETDYSFRLDRDLGQNRRAALSWTESRQAIDAFQFVAGQNPDTTLGNQALRLHFTHRVAGGDLQWNAQFQRNRSLLVPEPNAVGPRVRFGFQIEELGPDSSFPIDRVQNNFRYGFGYSRLAAGGRHQLFAGGDYTRLQLNGLEAHNLRGMFQFQNNFGRTAIENLRLGIPTIYEAVTGDLSRGFRQSAGNLYFADRIRLHARLQVYLGLRYSPEGAPFEVSGRGDIPYPCDCNNLSPRAALALKLSNAWTARAQYSLHYSPIPPVTWQQIRANEPHATYITVNNPDLLHPLRDIGITGTQPAITVLSNPLRTPYQHLYSLVLERSLPGRAVFRAGYTGSRAIKLLTGIVLNRAVPKDGIPYTTATINARRPDPTFGELRTVQNNGIAYYDGAQASIDLPLRKGFSGGAVYTFGKAIDTGSDFTATGANRDMLNGRAQYQYEQIADRKGLSNYDQTHSLSIRWVYDLPFHAGPSWLLSGWQFSGINNFRTGTPLTLFIGSDAPGFGNVDGSGGDRPNILDPSILGRTMSHPDIAPLILQRSRFAYLPVGAQRGSLGRNVFRKGKIANWNLALQKSWRLRHFHEPTLQLRGEAYNGFNTPQFDEPQRNLSSPAFGKITNTLNDGRVFQVSFRVIL
jgi:hypothetical protein